MMVYWKFVAATCHDENLLYLCGTLGWIAYRFRFNRPGALLTMIKSQLAEPRLIKLHLEHAFSSSSGFQERPPTVLELPHDWPAHPRQRIIAMWKNITLEVLPGRTDRLERGDKVTLHEASKAIRARSHCCRIELHAFYSLDFFRIH